MEVQESFTPCVRLPSLCQTNLLQCGRLVLISQRKEENKEEGRGETFSFEILGGYGMIIAKMGARLKKLSHAKSFGVTLCLFFRERVFPFLSKREKFSSPRKQDRRS